ncbi:MAG TPA: lipid-A-disaccharide synthase [Terriglobales bacterium]|nr:lipid-A-disaccharide synthase [Terriglobales bacterium]
MTSSTGRPIQILISAGEASGESYGAMLMAELRKLARRNIQFFGVGGEKMRAAGFETIVDSGKVAAVGITEVIKHVATIYREFFRMVAVARERKPDVAVLIDFPDFNLRLAGKLHEMGVPVVYFVSPQLWAWKQRRIWRVKKFVDRMLVIFPFEQDYYRKRGVNAEYVGHPLADLAPPPIPREVFAHEHGLDIAKQWIALLPGSRKKEVLLNLPVMLEAAARLDGAYEYLVPVASTLSHEWMKQQIGSAPVHLVLDARAALLHARASVVASGTATVEAALIGNPFIVVYRVSGLSYAIGKHLVKVKNFGMVNLIAGREIVPELIQANFTTENVAEQLRKLISDGPRRNEMIRELEGVQSKLRQVTGVDGKTAIARAAQGVLETLASPRTQAGAH